MATYSDYEQRQLDAASGLEMDRRRIERAVIGIDGNAGYALLGADLQVGEAEFITVEQRPDEPLHQAEVRAAFRALNKLRDRLGKPLTYAWYPRRPGSAGF